MKQKWLVTTARGTLNSSSHQELHTDKIELNYDLTPVDWFLQEELYHHGSLVLVDFWKIN